MIIHLVGPVSDATTLIANSLRNSQVGQAKGGLLVHDGAGGEPLHLIEKLVAGDPELPPAPLIAGTPAEKINWKREPMVILVNDRIKLLDEFEAIAPGFVEQLGPITKLIVED